MKNTMKIVLASLTAITLSGGIASAATCNLTDFTIGGENASECEGAFRGNDSNTNLDGLFNRDGWTEIVKVDDSSGRATDGGVTLSVALGDGGDKRSGSWSVTGWGDYTTVMSILKGSTSFAAYLLDTKTAETSGTWSTEGLRKGGNGNSNGKGNGNGNDIPGLSHLTLYSIEADISTTVAGSPDPSPVSSPSPVPLPAAGWLLLAGLGGFAALRRRESRR